jgi:hypothetical protein
MKIKLLICCIAALPLAACTTADPAMPLIFARTQTVGVSVAGSVPDQGAHITIGYADRNLAVVPTTAPNGERIKSIATEGDQPFEDAYSVLGQFELSTNAQQVSAGLGTFFSTGMASRTLAEGFRCKMGDCPK